jgi:hypothetical protein
MGVLQSIFGSKPDYSKVQDQYQQVQAIDPSITGLTSKASGNINSYLSGQIPTDVMDEIRNAGAAWGVQSGMPGSGADNNMTLESLGLSSLDLAKEGQADYMNFLTGVGSQMMPVQEQMTAANVAAAPDPATAGMWNELGPGLVAGLVSGSGGMAGGGNSPSAEGGGAGGNTPYNPESVGGYGDEGTSTGTGGYDMTDMMQTLYGGTGGSGPNGQADAEDTSRGIVGNIMSIL